jgi:GTP-binding protein
VGKSLLVNAFLNEDRHIVDDKPGTTRDAIDSKIKFFGQEIILIDTAGLRRQAKVRDAIEFFCNLRTQRTLDRCDIALVLFEALENITNQDAHIINEAVSRGKGVVLLANKWDLLEKQTGTFEAFRDEVYFRLPNLTYLPLITISALNKQRIHRALELALEVMRNCQMRITTSELNDYLLPIIEANPPPALENHYIKIKYATQASIQPTVFVFHCNFPDLVAIAYQRFLERKIRERYGFAGVPLKLKFLKK